MPAPVGYITRIRETTLAGLQALTHGWTNGASHRRGRRSLPLAECQLGLSHPGAHLRSGQVAFHWRDDTTLVKCRPTCRPRAARHPWAYDLTTLGATQCGVPIDALRHLVGGGVVGSLADCLHVHGRRLLARRVAEELAPRLTELPPRGQSRRVLFRHLTVCHQSVD
jgi:hypothetical protein